MADFNQITLDSVANLCTQSLKFKIYGKKIDLGRESDFAEIFVVANKIGFRLSCDENTDDLVFDTDIDSYIFQPANMKLLSEDVINMCWFCRNSDGFLDLFILGDEVSFPKYSIFGISSSLVFRNIN